MVGYSKFNGHDEAKDKKQMLKRAIIRLTKKGYFNKISHWQFYQRQGRYINTDTDKLLFILTPKQAHLEPAVLVDRDMVRFFERFYAFIRDGKDLADLLPPTRASFSKDDYLDVDKQFLGINNSEDRLNNVLHPVNKQRTYTGCNGSIFLQVQREIY